MSPTAEIDLGRLYAWSVRSKQASERASVLGASVVNLTWVRASASWFTAAD